MALQYQITKDYAYNVITSYVIGIRHNFSAQFGAGVLYLLYTALAYTLGLFPVFRAWLKSQCYSYACGLLLTQTVAIFYVVIIFESLTGTNWHLIPKPFEAGGAAGC